MSDPMNSGPRRFSKEAEQAVLGAMMISEDALFQCKAVLREDHFFEKAHRVIFSKIINLSDHQREVDLLCVFENMSEDELSDARGATYISELTETVPSIKNVMYYVEIVKNRFDLRNLNRVFSQGLTRISEGESDCEAILGYVDHEIQDIIESRVSKDSVTTESLIQSSLDQFFSRSIGDMGTMGVKLPWSNVDQYISHFSPGHMIVVGGRPSMGKTTISLNIFSHIAIYQAKNCVFFSLEMTGGELMDSLISTEAEIMKDVWKKPHLYEGQYDPNKLTAAVEKIGSFKNNIHIDDDPVLSPSIMAAKLRKIQREDGPLDLVVIDYLQLMDADPGDTHKNDTKTNMMATVSKKIKRMAKEFSVPIIALAQLNRNVESRNCKVPRMSDIRDCGSIEQDADAILFVHRPDYYKTDDSPGVTELIIAKNRHGETGTAHLTFKKRLGKFIDREE
jgi:replicative DNA helicase